MKISFAGTMRARLRGLLGQPEKEGALLLMPCNDVHTFGMREPIDIAFLAVDGRVVSAHRAVGPRRRIRCREAQATLERFANDEPWFTPGDRIELSARASPEIALCQSECLYERRSS